MADSEHFKWLKQGKDAWNERRISNPFKPDLRETWVLDFDLDGINLRDANCEKMHADWANMSGADLTGANLTDATFENVALTGADFTDTTTLRTDFTRSDTANLRIPPPKLWEARLFQSRDQLNQPSIDLEPVTSIEEFLRTHAKIRLQYRKPPEEIVYYFRGETECGRPLWPSVMRDKFLRESEGRMLIELMARRPEDFSDASSALDQLVLAQHHGLKTRLLDITRNPLVALFHACEARPGKKSTDGRIHVFAVPRSIIKAFTSDSISIIANFAKLPIEDQYEIIPIPGRNYERAMRRLYHEIRAEKPGFEQRIDPKDFYRVFVVEPRRSSERLRAQSGAFVLSMSHVRFERSHVLNRNPDVPIYGHHEITISADNKRSIRDELQVLNVTNEGMFPSLDSSAEEITTHTKTTRGNYSSTDDYDDIRFDGDVPV